MSKKGKWVNTPTIEAWFSDDTMSILCECDPEADSCLLETTPSEVVICPNCKTKYRAIVFIKPQVWREEKE